MNLRFCGNLDRQTEIKQNISGIQTHHLRELLTMTPLSIEKESLGRPAMFQALILMGSPKVLLREKSSDEGMFLDYRYSGR